MAGCSWAASPAGHRHLVGAQVTDPQASQHQCRNDRAVATRREPIGLALQRADAHSRSSARRLRVEPTTKALVGLKFDERVCVSCERHFGQRFYAVNAATGTLAGFLMDPYRPVEDFLDAVEILAEEANMPWTYTVEVRSRTLRADQESKTA